MAAAAAAAERLFSLELLVDWVRLEAAPPPRAPGPALAFRLLDFPPLLVRPPPAAALSPQGSGAIGFGRGKACVFRLRPAALLRPRLSAALLLPPADAGDAGGPEHAASRLLGTCDIPLAAAAPRGRRGTFVLRSPAGRRVGDLALFYRLQDLGARPPHRGPEPSAQAALEPHRGPRPSAQAALEPRRGPEPSAQAALEPRRGPGPSAQAALEPRRGPEPSAQAALEPRRLPDPGAPFEPQAQVPWEPCPGELGRPASAQDARKEAVFRSESSPMRTHSQARASSPAASQDQSISSPHPHGAELEFATNTFCPPPLFYTHWTQEKAPPAPAEITIEPQRLKAEELDGDFSETEIANPLLHLRSPECVNPAIQKGPPMPANAPRVLIQDLGGSKQDTHHRPAAQTTIDTLRQLPLLNALLIELSLLYNQPVASPTHVHPHLAWLYRTEEKMPECSTKSSQPELQKDKCSVGENEKTASLLNKQSQVESLKRGKDFDQNCGSNLPKKGARGRLLYGLTNTLRLRLKQTNPGMLIVHEKREQYRKRHAQTLGTKFRMPSCKVKSLSFAEQSQKPQKLPKDQHLDSVTSFIEGSGTSRIVKTVPGEPCTEQREQRGAAEKATIDSGDYRRDSAPLGTAMSPADSIASERPMHLNTWARKLDTEGQSSCVVPQNAVGQIVDWEISHGQIRATDNKTHSAGMADNTVSKTNNCCENILDCDYSDDFTSPCYSEDFYAPEDSSRSLEDHSCSSAGTAGQKHRDCLSKSSETRLSLRKSSSEKNSLFSPPFSAGSPVPSHKRSHIKTPDKSVEDVSSISSNDLSSLSWTKKNENHIDQSSTCTFKIVKTGKDVSIGYKEGAGPKSIDRSQTPRTSQVSSYLPSNLSELELKDLESSSSDHFEEEDDICSLNTSKQYRDICELVINKLPGYTM